MENRFYILHSSAIIQNGLANYLQKFFKCTVKNIDDFESLKELDEQFYSNSILFIEEKIANDERVINFIDSQSNLKYFKILNNETTSNESSISIFNSPDEIYEQVKNILDQIDLKSEEPEGLSNREIDVLKLVAQGYSNKEIADQLFISTHTVMSHRKNMTEKLGIKSISGLTVYAIINNYIDTEKLDIKDLI